MSSDDKPLPGPSEATLNWLRANMKGMAEGVAKKTLVGKGKPVKHDSPRKWCGACGVGFDFGPVNAEDPPMAIETATCPECQTKLDAGQVCFTDKVRYAFCVPSEKLKDFAGQVVPVSPHVIEEILRVLIEKQEKANAQQSGAA